MHCFYFTRIGHSFEGSDVKTGITTVINDKTHRNDESKETKEVNQTVDSTANAKPLGDDAKEANSIIEPLKKHEAEKDDKSGAVKDVTFGEELWPFPFSQDPSDSWSGGGT